MKKNKICVYAICKNEKQFVEKWLNNMSEADYVVVLDTGSTDGTYEMLQQDKRVTKVEQKIYDNFRFDVARNDSMKLCPDDANILICTDFDELLNPGWAKILRDSWNSKYTNGETITRGIYLYAWNHTSSGEPCNMFIYDKIHTRDYHWIYPVHEVLMPNKTEEEGFHEVRLDFGTSIFLQHYQDTTKPRRFYFDLLKLSCEENPDDSHARMLLAREYLLKKEYESAIEEYLKVLQMPDVNQPNKRLVLLGALFHISLCYESINNYDECIWYCQEFIKEDPTYRDPYFLMSEVYNLMGMYTLGNACVKAGFEYGIRKYDWVENGGSWTGWGYDLLAVSSFYTGKVDLAIENGNKALEYDPDNPRILKNQNIYMKQKVAILEKQMQEKEQQTQQDKQ